MLTEMINKLKEDVIEYASLVENMIDKCVKGLEEKNKDVLNEVIEVDETSANDREIEIEEICVQTIAQFEPKAKDLREVLMILKMNNDLERMADHAVNISESTSYLIERPTLELIEEIPKLSEVTIIMLRDSIDSFINENSKLAKSVCKRDTVVDDLRDSILSDIKKLISEEPGSIERLLHILRISKSFERIADLSTNICEDVIYMVEGRIIKHHLENIED